MSKELKELIKGLKDKLQVFHLLSDEELDKVIPLFELVKYPAGATLFNEGDPGDYFAVVLSGKLEVKKQTEFKDKSIVLALLGRGSFTGELSMLDGQVRSAGVVAHEDSELFILKRETLDRFMDEYPHIGIKILKGIVRTMSIRLRKSVERMATIF
ncbi:MAG: cyclic nucleotide-binding domain-containing protein [Nitrospirae bacterium]|nr:cyclic nucleotide-binding domain-containing protein [Nitrospirota bacterium]